MERALTIDQLLTQVRGITSHSDARAVVNRATRVAGISHDDTLELNELLRVCAALAAEGGLIQQLAEDIATRALEP